MGEPFRRADDSSARAPFIKGLLVGVVAIALIWGITYALRSPESAPAEQSASQAVQAGSDAKVAKETPGPTAEPGPSAEAQCQEALAAQAPPRRAAAAALSQWSVHVGAMNKLVAGQISLSQASAFWNRTRVGAKRLLARYDAAVRTSANADVTCPDESGGADGAHSTCQMAVMAGRHELRTAATAIDTWRHHVVDMDMLRMGHLSATQASRMWLRNWQKGVAQLDRYREARKQAQAEHC
jgi:hypothetical protein